MTIGGYQRALSVRKRWSIPRKFNGYARGQPPGVTVTPISRPVVKGKTSFFGSASCQSLSFVSSSSRVRTAPVSSVDGCVRMTDRARHPSGSSSGPSEGLRLGGMAAPEERWYPTTSKRVSQNGGCRRAGANLRMACGAGDPLSRQLVTAIRRPIQCRWLWPQSPYVACRIVVVLQAKQRVTSNGLPSFRM
jgi:hypothetical protein